MSQRSDDLTLDQIREILAPAITANAAFDGWTMAAVRNAALARGIDEDVAAYAFRDGQMGMIAANAQWQPLLEHLVVSAGFPAPHRLGAI